MVCIAKVGPGDGLVGLTNVCVDNVRAILPSGCWKNLGRTDIRSTRLHGLWEVWGSFLEDEHDPEIVNVRLCATVIHLNLSLCGDILTYLLAFLT